MGVISSYPSLARERVGRGRGESPILGLCRPRHQGRSVNRVPCYGADVGGPLSCNHVDNPAFGAGQDYDTAFG
jgi:hypothetical protein